MMRNPLGRGLDASRVHSGPSVETPITILGLRRALWPLVREKERQLLAQFWASSQRFSECRKRARKPTTRWLCWEAAANASQLGNSLIPGKMQGIPSKSDRTRTPDARNRRALAVKFPTDGTGNLRTRTGNCFQLNSEASSPTANLGGSAGNSRACRLCSSANGLCGSRTLQHRRLL